MQQRLRLHAAQEHRWLIQLQRARATQARASAARHCSAPRASTYTQLTVTSWVCVGIVDDVGGEEVAVTGVLAFNNPSMAGVSLAV